MVSMNRYKHGWTDTRLPWFEREQLRLRDNGDGTWSIVRLKEGASYGTEVVANGLTLKAASQMIELAKEK